MTAVYLLIRMQEYDEAPAFVRAYRTNESAHKASEAAHAYLTAPDAPQHPQGAPEGFTVSSVVGPEPDQYKAAQNQPWMREAQSRAMYPAAWALFDARKAAYHWWLQANPIDPGAPAGTVYVVDTVEFTDA